MAYRPISKITAPATIAQTGNISAKASKQPDAFAGPVGSGVFILSLSLFLTGEFA
jgi:hypothetical protein